ncbi:SSI family serine proteinase inhibitor [Streptomyces sp. TP-A0874]|uniref:SSI family serine proteinase inhibitor n=1 Tax=Streptomyces sp. TP-A0874 TaxID=549819 RepID=UPI0008536369|nr:SSI family serine proteinase inhibitor [Streptomyces sp. TP-A0874]
MKAHHVLRHCVRVLAAAALASTPLLPGTAQAVEPDQLFLRVVDNNHSWVRGVRLSCPPDGVRHPNALAACQDLRAARGNLNRLPGDPHACSLHSEPVTATADGSWRGKRIHWRKEFANPCALDAYAGPVFRF